MRLAPRGSISDSIQHELARSERYWTWLTHNLHGVAFDKSRRNAFAMAMFQVAADHQSSIVSAVKERRFASALALVRSLVEATVMGMWILHAATDDVLERMTRMQYAPPSLDDMIKGLDRQGFFDRPMYRDIADSIRRMHGFNHGGIQHIAARYDGERVGANYSHDDMVWALRTSDLFAALAALECAHVVGDVDLGETMYREARVWLGIDKPAEA